MTHSAPTAPPLLMACPHLRTRVKLGREGWPIAEYCAHCGYRRTIRATQHLRYNEATGAEDYITADQVAAGRLPNGSVIVDTEYRYGPWRA